MVHAQDDSTSLFVLGGRAYYGFIIPHSKSIEDISHTNPFGVEVDLNWHLRHPEVWRYCFCYPRAGVSVFYSNYDNPDILGSAVSVYPFIEPFINAHKPLSWSVRFGIGPAFMTRVYDEESNPRNLFYSTHLSFIAMLNLGMNYRFNERWNTRLAFNYNHISNGGIKEPNKGINFPGLNLGLDYSFRPVYFPNRSKDPDIVLHDYKNRLDLVLLGTGKTATKGEEYYPVMGVALKYTRVVGRVNGITAGAEWVSDHSKIEIIRRSNLTGEDGELLPHERGAFLVGNEFLLGKFIFSQQLGIYFYAPHTPMEPVYQRYGLAFRFTDWFYFGINIKAHRHVADFLDARAAFSLQY